jgi:NADPH:quinone reductase-like Zn-dependent oxidoreductase
MRAAVHRRFGGPEVVRVEEIPVPTVGPHDVLVHFRAGTVSAADRRARSRDVPRGLGIPTALALGVLRPRHSVLGMDVAGVVAEVGPDVTRFRPGDEVFAMLGARFGGHAEYAVVGQDAAIAAKPRGTSFEDAAALVFGGITARGFLKQVPVGPGTTVLVNGAAGAVGTATVQLAAHAGAHVTAVCAGDDADLVTSLGAARVIDYTRQDFTREQTTWDVVVDCVGNAPFPRVRARLAPGGALLLVVTDLRGLLAARRRSRTSGHPVVTSGGPYLAEDLAHLARLSEQGAYHPVVHRRYDLADVAEAHRVVDAGHKKGSVVLRMTGPAPDDRAPLAASTSRHPTPTIHPDREGRPS